MSLVKYGGEKYLLWLTKKLFSAIFANLTYLKIYLRSRDLRS